MRTSSLPPKSPDDFGIVRVMRSPDDDKPSEPENDSDGG